MPPRLERLLATRGDFDRDAVRERTRLIRALARVRWQSAADLAAYHDELLFTLAFPGSRAACQAARSALDRIAMAVARLPAADRSTLDDSGIAGTVTTNSFIYGFARHLAARAERLRFHWTRPGEAERLDPLLRRLLAPAEEDRFDSGEIGTQEWITQASAGAASDVGWLLAAAPDARTSADGRQWRALFDEADLTIRWDLDDSTRSATRCRVPVRARIRRGFRRPPTDVAGWMGTPLRGIRVLEGVAAERWHDAALSALASRAREVFPTVYANPREVVLAPLGEGATLCLLGVAPADRSALEANYGYVIFANGVPVGYGGFTSLGWQCNTGANLFESFRNSEAAFLFGQSLRAARTYLGVSRFLVNPYQVGAGNPEAIASGAYWFYDRLGFRPVGAGAARIAARERDAIARDRTHRSSAGTLRRIARSDLALDLGPPLRRRPIPESILVHAGALATHGLSAVPAGARGALIEAQARELKRLAGAGGALSAAERRGAALLVPILAPLIPRIATWRPHERRALWQLVALKGASREAGFARASARCVRLWEMLRVIKS